jgi:uncharacterized protein (TIGR00251 family)
MTLPPYLRTHPEGSFLHIKLQPRASETALAGTIGEELKIKVTAPPVDAAANDALIRFLSDRLHCPKSAVQLVRGQTSRHKVVWLQGVEAETVLANLGDQANA